MSRLSDADIETLDLLAGDAEVYGRAMMEVQTRRFRSLLDSHASLEAEVLRLRGLLERASAFLGNSAESYRLRVEIEASAPTPEAPPSRSVQRRLAAQGAPTSGQGAAAACVGLVGGGREALAPAPAAQPATETCGTCHGLKGRTRIVGRRRQFIPCGTCRGQGTTPRKEGP